MTHGRTAAKSSNGPAIRGSTTNQGGCDAAILNLDLPVRGRTEALEPRAGALGPQADAGRSQRNTADELRGLALRVRSLRAEERSRDRVPQSDGAARPGFPQSLSSRGPQEEG